MKKKLIIIVVFVIFLTSISVYASQQGYFSPGIKQCPSAWIDDQMPSDTIANGGETQYLIVDGSNREPKDFNLQWIRSNCEINEPEVVY